jgi:hypothetical protein
MLNRKRVLALVVSLGMFTFAALAQVPTSNSASRSNTGTSAGPEYFTVSPTISAPGQFVEFSWHVTNAVGFAVTPSLLSEDEDSLPLSAANYAQVAPTASTTFRGVPVRSPSTSSQPMSAALTIVPLQLTASARGVSAGQSVVFRFGGPNNGSSFFLTVLP